LEHQNFFVSVVLKLSFSNPLTMDNRVNNDQAKSQTPIADNDKSVHEQPHSHSSSHHDPQSKPSAKCRKVITSSTYDLSDSCRPRQTAQATSRQVTVPQPLSIAYSTTLGYRILQYLRDDYGPRQKGTPSASPSSSTQEEEEEQRLTPTKHVDAAKSSGQVEDPRISPHVPRHDRVSAASTKQKHEESSPSVMRSNIWIRDTGEEGDIYDASPPRR
jgi:hypothetical protein